jgi:hypothetical protein
MDFEQLLAEATKAVENTSRPSNLPTESPPVGEEPTLMPSQVTPAAERFSKIFQVTLWQEAVTHFHATHLLQGEYGDVRGWWAYKEREIRDGTQLDEEPPDPDEFQIVVEAVSQTLEKRGLPRLSLNLFTQPTLDPNFVIACDKIFDLADTTPTPSKLKSIGMTTRQFQALKKQRHHKAYYEKLVQKVWDEDTFDEGRIALARNVSSGDLPSIKYFNEMTGKFVQQRDFDPRVIGAMLQAIIGIVTRYVDESQAVKISEEIDQAATLAITGGQLTLPSSNSSDDFIDLD